MEELLDLKQKLLHGNISRILFIVEELEEMSQENKINNIRSYAIILLKYLIKQQAEKRSTKSEEVSIRNSVCEIKAYYNKRKKNKGVLSFY